MRLSSSLSYPYPSSLFLILLFLTAGLNAGVVKNPDKLIPITEKGERGFPMYVKNVNIHTDTSALMRHDCGDLASCELGASVQLVTRDNTKPSFLKWKMSNYKSDNKGGQGCPPHWLIPCLVTIGTGAAIYAVYSLRGR